VVQDLLERKEYIFREKNENDTFYSSVYLIFIHLYALFFYLEFQFSVIQELNCLFWTIFCRISLNIIFSLIKNFILSHCVPSLKFIAQNIIIKISKIEI